MFMAHLTKNALENKPINYNHTKIFSNRERTYRALRAGAALLAAFGVYEGVIHMPGFNPTMQSKTHLIPEHGQNGSDDIGYKVITTENPK
jgi:predicted AlkP superfamily pyrophosphatase or phosphodiesterase